MRLRGPEIRTHSTKPLSEHIEEKLPTPKTAATKMQLNTKAPKQAAASILNKKSAKAARRTSHKITNGSKQEQPKAAAERTSPGKKSKAHAVTIAPPIGQTIPPPIGQPTPPHTRSSPTATFPATDEESLTATPDKWKGSMN